MDICIYDDPVEIESKWSEKISCSKYKNSSKFLLFVLGSILFFIFFSYIPQFFKIVRKKKLQGISASYIYIGFVSTFLSILISVLSVREGHKCCLHKHLKTEECVMAYMPVMQISIQFITQCTILALIMFYTYRLRHFSNEFNVLKYGLLISLSFCLVALTFFALVLFGYLKVLIIATIFGIISAGLIIVKYIPQLYTTFRNKASGSLSIVTMLIQTPGGLILTLCLFFLASTEWTTWISFLTALILQGCVLMLCVYYDYIKKVWLNNSKKKLEK